MLKELVRERLIAAADEIFGLFERTIASYDEQLCRAREESERHRRQLEAVYLQQLIGHQEELPPQPHGGSSSWEQQPPHIKEEEEDLQPPDFKEEDEHLEPSHVKEEEEGSEICKFPLTGVRESGGDKDGRLEWSQLHHHHSLIGEHCGRPARDNLFVPLSHSDDIEEPLRSDADCSEKETTFSNKEPSQTHTGEKLLSCSVCRKRFSQKRHLVSHMRSHTGEKPFGCSVCGKRFTLKSTMVKHIFRTHTGEKPFSCSVCDKMFPSKYDVASHMRTHTGEKPYSCSTCGKTFSHKHHLVDHMRTHTGEKPFACSVCDKRFTLKATMLKHIRTHTGEKPFSCSVCDKKFSSKYNMLKHENTHRRISL